MAQLLIGHVSATSARVWVHGAAGQSRARLRYRAGGESEWRQASAELQDRHGYTGVVELTDLTPATAYGCELILEPGNGSMFSRFLARSADQGSFVTAPAPGGREEICFLFGSCNWTRVPLNLKDPEPAWERIGGLAASEKADFMIHCGDQIYADIPEMPPDPNAEYYRRLYREAWKLSSTGRVLATVPNYMTLDDHEIFDNYSADAQFTGRASWPVREAALTAYREFQHLHNPQTYPEPALYFNFTFGPCAFFAMDVRTERYRNGDSQMIGALQLDRLKEWLLARAKEPKFVVSAIPFVGEVRNGEDKWCGASFRHQREEIVDFVAQRGIGKLVFLSGDMHCSYHAAMDIVAADGRAVTIHELMSSPINQFGNGSHAFVDRPPQTTPGGATYRTSLSPAEFYGAHSNVMVVRASGDAVSYSVFRTKRSEPPEIQGAFGLS